MKSGDEVLKEILLGGSLANKLQGMDLSFERLAFHSHSQLTEALESPGREGVLKPGGRGSSAFPKQGEILKDKTARGRLLHFFANHELLAIETMAYVLLKFPEAPESFRKGVFRILQEEQNHLSRYLERMEDYGVEFGSVPLNLYFWNTLKTISSPFDFVTRMSLTFEQANLDFALEYAELFEREIDDPKTAEILRLVHDEEIRHVEHGWKWFQHWRDPEPRSDFDAYRAALPFPMSPRRARGARLFASESRRKAGLTENFIEEVRVSGGSRGRVPDYYFFNPASELESEKGTLPKVIQEKIQDLEALTLFLAREEDVVELSKRPPLVFLKQIHELKGHLPEIVLPDEDLSRFVAFDQFKPWGYSRCAWTRMDHLGKRFRKPPSFERGVHESLLYSKGFWKGFLKTQGSVIREPEALTADVFGASDVFIKSAFGTSGRGHLRLTSQMSAEPKIIEKLKKRVEQGETLVIEPFYQKIADFSVQYELDQNGVIHEFEPRFFMTDLFYQYQGAFLGRLGHGAHFDLAWQTIQKERHLWRTVHLKVAERLKEERYHGPFGVDCMVAEKAGASFVVPVIEVNVRTTMGRVAHEIEAVCQRIPGFKQGVWRFFGAGDLVRLNSRNFKELDERFQSQFGENYFATTPAETARSTFTAVFLNAAVSAAD
jgi:uncharacterized ferritin-like protein (DUF455 family)